MSNVWGYSDLLTLLEERSNLKSGLVVDTNVLISATYDSDSFYEPTIEFLDMVFENKIPLYYNSNVKMEFLEIHRRIIFTESLLDLESLVDKNLLPIEFSNKLGSLRAKSNKNKRELKPPIRLGEAELKEYKIEMLQIEFEKKDLWTELCENRVGNKLTGVWTDAEDELGLNILSTQNEDTTKHLDKAPDWADAIKIMESQGLSSSDAMIVNMFLCSKFDAIVTSDKDVGLAIAKIGNGKICILPEKIKTAVKDIIK
ncbi:MAG: hypothetical protein SGJ18_00280 [Pseudomonadota bacterium]|nr:hypothetical protein [Pseudomonadota bacterium]